MWTSDNLIWTKYHGIQRLCILYSEFFPINPNLSYLYEIYIEIVLCLVLPCIVWVCFSGIVVSKVWEPHLPNVFAAASYPSRSRLHRCRINSSSDFRKSSCLSWLEISNCVCHRDTEEDYTSRCSVLFTLCQRRLKPGWSTNESKPYVSWIYNVYQFLMVLHGQTILQDLKDLKRPFYIIQMIILPESRRDTRAHLNRPDWRLRGAVMQSQIMP